jgi:hypothetical protein
MVSSVLRAFSGYASCPWVGIMPIERSMRMMRTHGHDAYPLGADLAHHLSVRNGAAGSESRLYRFAVTGLFAHA